ncbi:MAG TPA: OmpA family protein [Vicinamibacterales bacterium]|nr:OmpA family protein [Vicinamibacterales bacterium]
MNRGVRVTGVIALALTIGVSACGKKKPAAAPAPPPPAAEAPRTTPAAPPPPPPAPAPAPTRTPSDEEIYGSKTLDDLSRELAPVFFELDSAQLNDAARPVLQKNSEWLKRWPAKIMIEGHADSRGTAEYNLALGERRAAAVRDYLVSLGVAANRIQIVSKGKESPFCTEENEGCWQQNRRGHFVVTAK